MLMLYILVCQQTGARWYRCIDRAATRSHEDAWREAEQKVERTLEINAPSEAVAFVIAMSQHEISEIGSSKLLELIEHTAEMGSNKIDLKLDNTDRKYHTYYRTLSDVFRKMRGSTRALTDLFEAVHKLGKENPLKK